VILKEYSKHPKLARPASGNFGRNEIAFVGTNCGEIKNLAGNIIEALAVKYHCAYADASHAYSETETPLPGRLANGAFFEYTDQINYHQFEVQQQPTSFQFRQYFNSADLVLVNGNHHQGKSQVVIIDPVKEASLQKRLNQLTDVKLFLLTENISGIFGFLKEAIPDWEKIPVYQLSETAKINRFFEDQLEAAKPKINGLVLAGGKSQRMGTDKALLNWHGKEQQYFMADLLQEFCEEVYLSCCPEQVPEIDPNYQVLPDTFTDLGPFGAILSAFRQQPDAAWLVVACDLPLLDKTTLGFLLENRSVSAVATTFQNPEDSFPEPLITIWEPKSYPVLLSFLSQGYSCPRKVLINSEVKMLKPENTDALRNVNTPEEREAVKQILKQKSEAI
jgi:molybdopterin-guanine dinucleotide biosynthesis protein A